MSCGVSVGATARPLPGRATTRVCPYTHIAGGVGGRECPSLLTSSGGDFHSNKLARSGSSDAGFGSRGGIVSRCNSGWDRRYEMNTKLLVCMTLFCALLVNSINACSASAAQPPAVTAVPSAAVTDVPPMPIPPTDVSAALPESPTATPIPSTNIPTRTSTNTATATQAPTNTHTLTPTLAPTRTPTDTATHTPTLTFTPTRRLPTRTPTLTAPMIRWDFSTMPPERELPAGLIQITILNRYDKPMTFTMDVSGEQRVLHLLPSPAGFGGFLIAPGTYTWSASIDEIGDAQGALTVNSGEMGKLIFGKQ